MLGTKDLKPAIETGIDAIRKADDGLRLCLMVAAATLVISLCTLAAVLARA